MSDREYKSFKIFNIAIHNAKNKRLQLSNHLKQSNQSNQIINNKESKESNEMIKPKICMGILTCPNTKKRFDKFMNHHEKWLIENDIKYYIIQSDPTLIGKEEYKIDGNNFYCGCKEAYETLAHKLAIFYGYIYEKTDYTHIIKVDDGCLLKKENVLNLKNKPYDYCGSLMVPTSNKCHIGKCSDKKYHRELDFNHGFNYINNIDRNKLASIKKIEYAGGGYGYCLSRKSLSVIAKYKAHILKQELSYEDVIFGQIMYLEGIKPTYYHIGDYHAI